MTSIEEITRAYWKAEESRDLDRILEFFAPDADWQGPGISLRGRQQIRPFYAESAARFPRLSVQVQRVFGTQEEASLEFHAIFHDPAGQQFELRGVNVMRGDGERITSLTTYIDPAALSRNNAPVAHVAVQDRFAGKHVLVTGAASGIGAATAKQFLAEGAIVTGVDTDGDGFERHRALLGDLALSYRTLVADVTDPDQQRDMVAMAAGNDGQLDVLVNNAAVFLLAADDADDYQWRRTLEVNLMAPAQLVATAVPALSRASSPAVVNLASISAHRSQSHRWTYNASKGGVLALTKCQAHDLGTRGIRVNSVSPGFTWTELLDRGAGGDRAKWDPIWGANCLLQRCADPHEVAQVIAFLASDAASYITGNDVLVDGGMVTMSPEGLTYYEFES